MRVLSAAVWRAKKRDAVEERECGEVDGRVQVPAVDAEATQVWRRGSQNGADGAVQCHYAVLKPLLLFLPCIEIGQVEY